MCRVMDNCIQLVSKSHFKQFTQDVQMIIELPIPLSYMKTEIYDLHWCTTANNAVTEQADGSHRTM